MTLADWMLVAQVALLALVPAIGWVAARIVRLRAASDDLDKRVTVLESHDIGDVKDTLHGRVTEVAKGLEGVKGSLDQLNHTNGQLLRALIKEPE